MKNINFEELAFEFQTTGISLTKLAERENTTRQTLSRNFKKLGINVVNKQNRVKFNENVFDKIDTEEKAYWLGFIFADGSIREQVPGKKVPYTLEISLKGLDVDHLHKFNKFMEHESDNVKMSNSKCGDKTFLRCRWIVTNKHLWNTLNNIGCTPNKSLTLKFPDIDENLHKHFIRGYFDGDGCISRHINKKSVTPSISLLGTKSFLESIEKIIGIECNYRHDSRHSEFTYSIEFNKDNGIKFIKYMYDDANVYLDRKYKLYQFFKNGSRSVEEFTELSSGNIGRKPEMENIEINLETNKSKSSYSVESETFD